MEEFHNIAEDIYIYLREVVETKYDLFCDIIATKILPRPKRGRDNV